MNYVKLVNVPLGLTREERYGNGKEMAWEACVSNAAAKAGA